VRIFNVEMYDRSYNRYTPGVNFTNILGADFAPIFLRQKSNLSKKKLRLKLSYEKAAHKILVKMTPDDKNANET
jgi:hypothetical protein